MPLAGRGHDAVGLSKYPASQTPSLFHLAATTAAETICRQAEHRGGGNTMPSAGSRTDFRRVSTECHDFAPEHEGRVDDQTCFPVAAGGGAARPGGRGGFCAPKK